MYMTNYNVNCTTSASHYIHSYCYPAVIMGCRDLYSCIMQVSMPAGGVHAACIVGQSYPEHNQQKSLVPVTLSIVVC